MSPRTNPIQTKTLGEGTQKSRPQAELAAKRTTEARAESSWPLHPDGHPLTKIVISASELIPTGQFANVSVGPIQIEHFIDPLSSDNFPDEVRENIAKALNELFEIAELDVVAVQRNLVHESLQEQIADNGKSK